MNFKPDLFSIYAESFQQNPKIKQVRVETVISIELILQLLYQQDINRCFKTHKRYQGLPKTGHAPIITPNKIQHNLNINN